MEQPVDIWGFNWSSILSYTGYTPLLYRLQWPNQFVIRILSHLHLLPCRVIAHCRWLVVVVVVVVTGGVVVVMEGSGMRWNDRGGRGDKFVELALCQQSGVDTLTVCMLTRLVGIHSGAVNCLRESDKICWKEEYLYASFRVDAGDN